MLFFNLYFELFHMQLLSLREAFARYFGSTSAPAITAVLAGVDKHSNLKHLKDIRLVKPALCTGLVLLPTDFYLAFLCGVRVKMRCWCSYLHKSTMDASRKWLPWATQNGCQGQQQKWCWYSILLMTIIHKKHCCYFPPEVSGEEFVLFWHNSKAMWMHRPRKGHLSNLAV